MGDQLQQLRDTLAADGYSMDIHITAGNAIVKITAADGVCGDCLVPKNVMMKGLLEPALGMSDSQIQLTYPTDAAASPSSQHASSEGEEHE